LTVKFGLSQELPISSHPATSHDLPPSPAALAHHQNQDLFDTPTEGLILILNHIANVEMKNLHTLRSTRANASRPNSGQLALRVLGNVIVLGLSVIPVVSIIRVEAGG
jgi:hypothetical protein